MSDGTRPIDAVDALCVETIGLAQHLAQPVEFLVAADAVGVHDVDHQGRAGNTRIVDVGLALVVGVAGQVVEEFQDAIEHGADTVCRFFHRVLVHRARPGQGKVPGARDRNTVKAFRAGQNRRKRRGFSSSSPASGPGSSGMRVMTAASSSSSGFGCSSCVAVSVSAGASASAAGPASSGSG